jgi:hypothetical protein
MELSYEEVERYLNRVFTGIDYTYVNKDNIKHLMFFVYPDSEVKQKAEFVYADSYNNALADGLLPSKDLEELIHKRNIFTKADEDSIKRLQGQLEAQYILLNKTTKVKANRDRIKRVIENLERQVNEILYKKTSKMIMSADSKAEEERSLYIASHCCFWDENKSLIWPTYKDALKEVDLIFKDKVLFNFLNFYRGLSTEIIRAIARHSIWRIRYVTSIKVSESLFGIPTSQYNPDQLSLAYWSNFYQSVYEMLPEDRPSDLIIDDDKALDAYMKNYYEERNREEAARKSKVKKGGKLSAFDREEVIVTKADELYEEIEYDKPREAQRIKDRTDLRKKAKRRRS